MTIKFRGKRIDNNEWAYGYYYEFNHKHFICYQVHSDNATTDYNHEIEYKTLGMFTGIIDKNDNPIYEGDIVKNGMSGNWIIQPFEEGAMSLFGTSPRYEGSNYDISALNEYVEVIGNIHDKIT